MPKFQLGNKVAVKQQRKKRIMQSFRLLPETIAKTKQYAELHSSSGKKMSLSEVIDLAITLIAK